jgi:hypothetical protein
MVSQMSSLYKKCYNDRILFDVFKPYFSFCKTDKPSFSLPATLIAEAFAIKPRTVAAEIKAQFCLEFVIDAVVNLVLFRRRMKKYGVKV